MTETFDIPRLIELRKLTRSISDNLQTQLKNYLATLAPLFSPMPLLGEHVRGGSKSLVKGAEKNFQDLRSRYHAIARQAPYSLDTELTSPLDVFTATPSLTPVEYAYTADRNGQGTQLTVTSPLKWVLSYPETQPKRLLELLKGNRSQVRDELSHALLQCLTLNLVLEKQAGLTALLKDLRFTISSTQLDGLGPLPILLISCPIATRLPPDDIIIQNTEISGIPSFEEIINIHDIQNLSDPLRERILEITQVTSPAIQEEISAG
ncbi:MAG: hypothetical protein ABW101_01465 [Candidatus Thiodiazotropha sp.]